MNDGGGGGYGGGGLLNFGNTTVTDVTFTADKSGGGGGARDIGGQLVLENDTFSGNMAYNGGAIYSGYGNSGTIVADNITVANNSATGFGGGIAIETGASFTIVNSIVADNTASNAPDCGKYGGGSAGSQGYNLIGADRRQFRLDTTDLTGTAAIPLNADLGPLASNGGPRRRCSRFPAVPRSTRDRTR